MQPQPTTVQLKASAMLETPVITPGESTPTAAPAVTTSTCLGRNLHLPSPSRAKKKWAYQQAHFFFLCAALPPLKRNIPKIRNGILTSRNYFKVSFKKERCFILLCNSRKQNTGCPFTVFLKFGGNNEKNTEKVFFDNRRWSYAIGIPGLDGRG